MMLACSCLLLSGCQSLKYWWGNQKMVGPNYSRPDAPVGQSWRIVDSPKIDASQTVDSQWWRVFNDPDLNDLIDTLKCQNLTLKAAAWRIREARLSRNIAAANLFPQSQTTSLGYSHSQSSRNSAGFFPGIPLTVDDWSTSFDISWEVDLWGRIRRSVAAADAGVDANILDYNFAVVSLTGEVASIYIQIRALDERIELARKNVELQEGSLDIARKRFKEGRTSKLDVVQAESNLALTRGLIPQFELARTQALNGLSVLLGLPPSEIHQLSDSPGKIPVVPPQAIVGIPSELLCRRPDIRSAERQMKAQFEQIGIAEADLYPTFAINGTLGWQATSVSDLFQSDSFTGAIAPGFRWNVLNYGRLKNAIGVQEARFEQIKADFQNQVLQAQAEVENGIIEFVKRSEQYQYDLKTAEASKESVDLAIASFTEGKTDFGRVFVVQTNLVTTQDQLVDTRTSIALALVSTYRALGGGWEVSSSDQDAKVLEIQPDELIPVDVVFEEPLRIEPVIVQ